MIECNVINRVLFDRSHFCAVPLRAATPGASAATNSRFSPYRPSRSLPRPASKNEVPNCTHCVIHALSHRTRDSERNRRVQEVCSGKGNFGIQPARSLRSSLQKQLTIGRLLIVLSTPKRLLRRQVPVFNARLFYDDNRDGVFTLPADQALTGFQIQLVYDGKPVGSGTTGKQGKITISNGKLKVGKEVEVWIKGQKRMLGMVRIAGSDRLIRMPLIRPPPVSLFSSFLFLLSFSHDSFGTQPNVTDSSENANVVTVSGYGLANATALLYTNNTLNVATPVGFSNSPTMFLLTSQGKLPSGTTSIAVAQRDQRGLTSKKVSASSFTLPFAPTIRHVQLNSNKTIAVKGTGIPEYEIRVYVNTILLGITYAIPPSGNFSFQSPNPLPIGAPNTIYVSQSNYRGESNKAWGGAYQINLPASPQVYGPPQVVGNQVTVIGSTEQEPGKVRLYSNWVEVGSAEIVGFQVRWITRR